MRQGEILGLRRQDLDREAHQLRVRQTLQRVGREIVIKDPKTDRSRPTLALTPSLVKELAAHKDRHEFERKKAGTAWQETGDSFSPQLSARRSMLEI
jgi:integrase